MALNLAHPITPSLFTNLDLPDYMFGVAFAAMCIPIFLLSPFWGCLSDKLGRVNVMTFGLLGYGFGQFAFIMAQNSYQVVFARFVSGIFIGGYLVTTMAFVADNTSADNRAKYMTYYVAFHSVSTSLGYLIGGIIGDISILWTVLIQVILMFVLATFHPFLLKNKVSSKSEKLDLKELFHSANPFSSFAQASHILNIALATFLLAVFLTSFATTGYDNAFNYYIRSELNFPPSYNGYIKAATGSIGIIVNFTANHWLAKNISGRKSIIIVLFLCSTSLFSVLLMGSVTAFLISNVIFYAFNSMYLPIQQTLMTESADEASNGVLAGLFNSIKAIGMIAGSLFAGLVYSIDSSLPFIFSVIAFLLATIFSVINYFQYKRKTHI